MVAWVENHLLTLVCPSRKGGHRPWGGDARCQEEKVQSFLTWLTPASLYH